MSSGTPTWPIDRHHSVAPEAPVVESTFYNFAPAMVRSAIPKVWDKVSPAGALELRDQAMTAALEQHLRNHVTAEPVAWVTEVGSAAALGSPRVGRPLFSAHAELPLPDHPLLAL